MLENYRKAFKAYDIRGKYGKEIDEKFAYTMGKAIAKLLSPEKGLLIGSDVRVENPDLIRYFEAGVRAAGFGNIFYAAFGREGKKEIGRTQDIASLQYPY
jgi:phosphomannomutase